jgi:hypothetical protein
MNFNRLSRLIFDQIKLELENNQGLFIFAQNRDKFEGWLKVKVCEILSSSEHVQNVAVEVGTIKKRKIDIVCDDWAIELKTTNTNYRYNNYVEIKGRPITSNVKNIIKDIKKLGLSKYPNKAVLFVVFPVEHNKKEWNFYIKREKWNLDSRRKFRVLYILD